MANDFHMGGNLPQKVSLGELRWGDNYVFGSQYLGIPNIINGRNKWFGWSMTIALTDSSDLWEEELSEDGMQYLVDGEWRNITQETYEIKVQGEKTVFHTANYTHRGVIVDTKTLSKLSRPLTRLGDRVYSLAWTMMQPGEKCFEFIHRAATVKTIPEMFKIMDEDSKLAGGYRGVTVNVIFADTEGNIGYQLLGPVPIRKDKTPFLGLRVLNGRTSAYDWVEDGVQTVPLS